MNSPEESLKPCPFCGYETPRITKVCDEKTSDFCWSVICAGCSCDTKHCLSQSEAAELWNTRTTPPTPHIWTAEELWDLFWENKKPMMQTTVDWKLFEVLADAINAKNQSNER